jgi:ketosteroid isomerase-like protein
MSDELIERFYAAFNRRDGEAMAACYAPNAMFADPAFGRLDAEQTKAMWQMLTSQADGLTVELLEHQSDGTTGSARWIARYTFTRTGRPVVNDVRSTFKFDDDGLIVEQNDKFGFYRWARQALGRKGTWLGWTPQLQLRVLREARSRLARFMHERDGGTVPAAPQNADE